MSHAKLSPSAASRWMECPGSIKLERFFPDKSSDYADEGSLAHELGKILLKLEFKHISRFVFNKELDLIKQSKFYNAEMQKYCEEYKAFVMMHYHEAGDGAQIIIEEKVSVDEWIKEGFGTVDVRIYNNRFLKIIDLKYGQGVEVLAEQNSQLMIYGLGVNYDAELYYNIEMIEMIIFQPRLENISSYTMAVTKLVEWGEKILKPKAEKAFNGVEEFKAGKHCQFCRVKPNCKTFANYNLEIAKKQFEIGDDEEELELLDLKDVHLMKDAQVAVIITKALEFKNWLSSVEEYALDQALNHKKKWPGLKLVRGISRRIITDEEKAKESLLKKYPADKVTKTKLIGIGDLEKLLGKDFDKFLGKFIFKPDGAPALVQISDKRPAINSVEEAKKQFASAKIKNP